jgi:hypothetical protein
VPSNNIIKTKNMLKESKPYKNYVTNEDGTYIENKITKNVLKPYISNSGYLFAAGIPVHRIVASAFNEVKEIKN